MTYSVNADGGYVAEVSYEGTAVFPEVKAFCPNVERSFANIHSYVIILKGWLSSKVRNSFDHLTR